MDDGQLSPRHRRILKLVEKGKTPAQIAEQLGITVARVSAILQGPSATRQRVLDMTARGMKPRAIARELDISIQAVHQHLRRHRQTFGKAPRRAAV